MIKTYIKENVIIKLSKLCSSPRRFKAGNELPTLFLNKLPGMGNLSLVHKIFVERPGLLKNIKKASSDINIPNSILKWRVEIQLFIVKPMQHNDSCYHAI